MAPLRGITLKSKRELAIMREAGRVNALALAAAKAAIRPGATTADVDEAAAELLKKHGAQPAFLGYGQPPYPAVTCVSVNEELVHGIPGKRRIREGDLVSVDCGAIFDGFVGDAAFSVYVGEPDELSRRLLEATEEALHAAIDMMRPGKKTGDVSAAMQRVAERAGFFMVRNYTSHGVGRAMHEEPQVPNYMRPGSGVLLRPGMTIALEPMVIVGTPDTRVLPDEWTVVSRDLSLTAHFEHTVAVTDAEPQILTVP
ncbi:MAG: type I methionyl aminopeptidase [Anaerolineales bacterium]|nr:type I methionyl aminopeptidase [Anaerolineales bacterium]